MALVKCRECGKEISDQAAACPSCGAPVAGGAPMRVTRVGAKYEQIGFGLIVVGLIALLAGVHWGGIAMLVGFVVFLVGRLQGDRVVAVGAHGGGSGALKKLSMFALFGVAALVLAVSGLALFLADDPPANESAAPAAALTPVQIRERQIQAALQKAYIPVQMQIQSMMHDPDSFEMVNTTYDDQGEYVVMSVTFRAKNSLGAKVLNTLDARVGLDGSVWTVGKIE